MYVQNIQEVSTPFSYVLCLTLMLLKYACSIFSASHAYGD